MEDQEHQETTQKSLPIHKLFPLIVLAIVNTVLWSVAIFFFATSYCIVENVTPDSLKSSDAPHPNYADSELTNQPSNDAGTISVKFGALDPKFNVFPEDDFVHDFECGIDKIKYNTRIVGGEKVIEGSWPWLVRLVMKGSMFMCGATLISPVHSISAAHCVQEEGLTLEIIYDNFDAIHGSRVDISNIRPHPLYDRISMRYDHAIITHSKIPFSDTVTPACLPIKPYPCGITHMFAAGYGHTKESGKGPRYMRQAKLPMVVPCPKAYHAQPLSMCAGKEGLDSCQGDSGGPFGTHVNGKWYLFGIVSFGEGCGRKGFPGYYARVDTLLNWFCCYLKDHKSCKGIICNKKGLLSYPPTTADNPQLFVPKEAPDCVQPSEWEKEGLSTNTGSSGSSGSVDSAETDGDGAGSPAESAGTQYTNDIGICIGEPYHIHKGWKRDGTKEEGSSSEKIGEYYVNAESSRSLAVLSRLFTNGLYANLKHQIRSRSITCECGQMNQAYFDFLKKTDILEYNNLWLSHIRGSAVVNKAVCKLV